MEDTNKQDQKETTELTETSGKSAPLDYLNSDAMNKAYRHAKVLAASDIVPDAFKGKAENILIAMDLANRTGFGLMQVMQNLYLVRGKISWSGSFCMSAIKASGLYEWVKYCRVGEPNTREYGYFVQALDKSTGQIVNGPLVDWATVKNEGWDSKPGSKWKTMPDLMFRYRAAAFFARTECPEVLQGLQTTEEVQDVSGYETPKKQKTKITLNGVEPEVYIESEVDEVIE